MSGLEGASVQIELNGDRVVIGNREPTVATAVELAGAELDAGGVAVAVEGEVVPRADWGSRRLEGGERVEVVRAVQGG